MRTFDRIYLEVAKIPKGKVLTYGNISVSLGINPRVVGYALHSNKNPKIVPCHRVVFKDGSLTKGFAFGGKDVQKKLLQNEGIEFVDGKVDLRKFLFRASAGYQDSSKDTTRQYFYKDSNS